MLTLTYAVKEPCSAVLYHKHVVHEMSVLHAKAEPHAAMIQWPPAGVLSYHFVEQLQLSQRVASGSLGCSVLAAVH